MTIVKDFGKYILLLIQLELFSYETKFLVYLRLKQSFISIYVHTMYFIARINAFVALQSYTSSLVQ